MGFIRTLIAAIASKPYRVEGDSMLPLLASGEYVLVRPIGGAGTGLSRGSIVVFKHPRGTGDVYLKRVVGIPGDHVRLKKRRIYLNGKLLIESYRTFPPVESLQGALEWRSGADEYFLVGDNRGASQDSRLFGPVKAALILGQVWLRYWPPGKLGPVHNG